MRESRPSILLVDDDPAIRSLLIKLLERDGYKVEAASDGAQALRKLKRNKYESILLDLLMPKVNGFEVLQDLRALQPETLGRIVVLTAVKDQTLVDFSHESRIFRLLRKPLDNEEVLSVVRSCTGRPAKKARSTRLAAAH